jgi:hypothetical protein
MAISKLRTLSLVVDRQYARALPPNAHPLLRWPAMQPGEALDYTLDVTAILADTFDRLGSASVRVMPSDSAGLHVDDVTGSGASVTLRLSHGAPGQAYSVAINLRTEATGRTHTFIVGITMLDRTQTAQQMPIQAFNLVTDQLGTAVTDQAGNPIGFNTRVWSAATIADNDGRTISDHRGMPISAN